jgi:hypothetical protein
LPRQFGAGEHGVFTGGIVAKTLALFLQQSTKGVLSDVDLARHQYTQGACDPQILPTAFTLPSTQGCLPEAGFQAAAAVAVGSISSFYGRERVIVYGIDTFLL